MQRHDPASSTSRRAILITPDRLLLEELEPLLNQQLAGTPMSGIGSYPVPRDLAQQLGSAPSQLIILDVSSDPDQALALIPELTRIAGTQVLAVLASNDPDSILRCLRAGAADFLLRPATGDQLQAALGNVARLQPVPEVAASGPGFARVVAVMPSKGACGATTLACNLAFQWKRAGAQKVLLADLDLLAGTVSFLLKLRASFSFMDVLQRESEMDPDLWRSTIASSAGVDVLLAPDGAVAGMAHLQDVSPIINFARTLYDVIIIDTGSVYGDWNLSQARIANDVLLVTTNELPALQATQRALSYLETNHIPKSKTRLVVNRYQRDVGLNRDVIGTALHSEVYADIPSDYESVQAALLEGKPVASSTAFGKGVAQLLTNLSGVRPAKPVEAPASSGGLTGLLGGLFSKKK